MLRAKGEAVVKRLPLQGGNHGKSPYALSLRLGPVTMTLLPDVPLAVFLAHLLALVLLLTHAFVTRLRRFVLLRQGRNVPGTFWSRLLHVLLGLPNSFQADERCASGDVTPSSAPHLLTIQDK